MFTNTHTEVVDMMFINSFYHNSAPLSDQKNTKSIPCPICLDIQFIFKAILKHFWLPFCVTHFHELFGLSSLHIQKNIGLLLKSKNRYSVVYQLYCFFCCKMNVNNTLLLQPMKAIY